MNQASAKFEEVFRAAGLPVKRVEAFGAQVIVTCWSEGAARKAASFLTRGSFKVLNLKRSIDYNEDQSKRNTLRPASHDVWLVWART